MITKEDLNEIKSVVKEVVEHEIQQSEKRILERFDELLKRIVLLEDHESENKLYYNRLKQILSDLEYRLIETRGALNGLLENYEKFHQAELARFERLERYVGVYKSDDPLILRDKDTNTA